MMRSISWLRPSTLFRKRGADDLDIGMGIRMVLGIGDCKTHKTQTHLTQILHLFAGVGRCLSSSHSEYESHEPKEKHVNVRFIFLSLLLSPHRENYSCTCNTDISIHKS